MTKMMIITLFVVVGLAAFSEAQTPPLLGCHKVKTQEKLDINKYLGYWYEVEAFPTVFESGKCIRARYSLKPDGHIEVYNRQIEDGKEHDITGDAYRPDDNEQGKLKVRFSKFQPYGNYWVVHTDYDNFSLIYSCTDVLGVFHFEMAWVLSRNMTLDPTYTQLLKDELASYDVKVSKFKATDQTDCPQ